jgi:hypothetical protein
VGKAKVSAEFQRQMEQMCSLKQVIFNNDAMGELPPITRLLFTGLWCLVDSKGRLEDRPRTIKKIIMGYDDVSTGQVDEMLQSLHDRRFIVRYNTNGNSYIQVNNFSKYRNPNISRKPSRIPPPELQ